MEIDIVKTDAEYLHRLRTHIQQGIRSSAVLDVEALLMKGLADAIAAEHRRSNVIDGDLSDYGLIATVDFKIRRERQDHAPAAAKKRELSSLLAELDDAATSKAGNDIVEASA